MTDFLTVASKSRSLFLGTLREGNRSPMRPMNIGTSSVTILGVLKSRKALIKTSSCEKLIIKYQYHEVGVLFNINNL